MGEKRYCEAEVRRAYHRLTRRLIAAGLTITTMESATSGQIASLITDTEGASAVLRGAFVTYSNEAKVMMGVDEEIIERFGVYSEETARAMANACAQKLGARIGVGVTGTMGNVDPANAAGSVPGRVYYALTFCGETRSFFLELPPQESRLAYKLAVAAEVERSLGAWLDEALPAEEARK